MMMVGKTPRPILKWKCLKPTGQNKKASKATLIKPDILKHIFLSLKPESLPQ
jgi:hypothetical protein